jgi:lipid-binding SYLF domain-containing protein
MGVAVSAGTALADSAQERLADSATVFQEIMSTPDKGIPQELLAKAECVVIVPGLKKAALGVGGQYGRGFAECRNSSGSGWSAPAAVRIEGGSVGLQIGASSTDVVMLVMNKNGMNKLLDSKFTIGADASAAAGPVGRTATASTDAQMGAEILSWSRSKGAFAGISLNGATLRNDLDENALVEILTKPRNAIIKQYQRLFEFENVRLKFTDDALHAIAREALNRKVGARGLRMILEELMLDLMYHLPSQKKVKDFEITQEMVEKRDISLATLEKQAS